MKGQNDDRARARLQIVRLGGKAQKQQIDDREDTQQPEQPEKYVEYDVESRLLVFLDIFYFPVNDLGVVFGIFSFIHRAPPQSIVNML